MTVAMKHPKALPFFFLTEMWERFGFYIVEGLLVLYLTKAFGFSDQKSYAILGAFAAYVYITPVIGGYLANNILGYRNAVMFGGVLLCIGYAVLAVFGKAGLYPGLAIIIAGNGFFKPNISSFLGDFYKRGDTRRDAGFTLFYMGINLGVLFATASSGFIQNTFGWWAPFACASVGLLIGIIIFRSGYGAYSDLGLRPTNPDIKNKFLILLQNKFLLALATFISIIIFVLLLDYEAISDILFVIIGVSLLGGLIYKAYQFSSAPKDKLLALIMMIFVSVVFWAIYFQMFFSTNLFIQRDINRVIFGFKIPTVAFISLEAAFIIITGPIFARLWQVVSRRNAGPTSPLKFALAFFSIALAFFLLYSSTHFVDAKNLINPLWIVFAYFFVTVGEMLLSPIGLSIVTKFSPPKLVGMMMGVWFIALGFGGKFAGMLADLAAIPRGLKDIRLQEADYAHAFLIYTVLAIVVGILMLMLVPLLNRLIAGKKPSYVV